MRSELRRWLKIPGAVWRNLPKTPRQLHYRITGMPVFANGVPKCGTHLLCKTLSLVPGLICGGRWQYFNNSVDVANHHLEATYKRLSRIPKGMFLYGHLVPQKDVVAFLKEKGWRTILIIRDPRDLVCSHAFYALEDSYRYSTYYQEVLDDIDDRLMTSIKGLSARHVNPGSERVPLFDIDRRYRSFLPWLKEELNLVVRFEDLIGPKGGGDLQRQHEAIWQILAHIHVGASAGMVERIANNLFGGTITFRKGKTHAWQQRFTEEHISVFKEIAGDLLIELGYETDKDW